MLSLKVTTRGGQHLHLDATVNRSLMESLRDSGKTDIVAMCGGCCACATCHVYIDEDWMERAGPPGKAEAEMLNELAHERPNSRLSCQVVVTDQLDGMSLSVAPEE